MTTKKSLEEKLSDPPHRREDFELSSREQPELCRRDGPRPNTAAQGSTSTSAVPVPRAKLWKKRHFLANRARVSEDSLAPADGPLRDDALHSTAPFRKDVSDIVSIESTEEEDDFEDNGTMGDEEGGDSPSPRLVVQDPVPQEKTMENVYDATAAEEDKAETKCRTSAYIVITFCVSVAIIASVASLLDLASRSNTASPPDASQPTPLPPSISQPPSLPQPTTDLGEVACELSADIACRTNSGMTCTSLAVPEHTCSGDTYPSFLQFIFTSNPCNYDPRCSDENGGLANTRNSAYLYIEGDTVFYDGVVSPGQFIDIAGSLSDQNEIYVYVYTVANNTPGLLVQYNRIDIYCNGVELELLREYGALQLNAYKSDLQGFQAAFQQVTIDYVTRNDGPYDAELTSAVASSNFDFLAGEELVVDGKVLAPGEIFTSNATGLVFLTRDADKTFLFDFDINGVGVDSGRACSSSANYFFTVQT